MEIGMNISVDTIGKYTADAIFKEKRTLINLRLHIIDISFHKALRLM